MVYLGKTVEREMYFGAKPDLFRLANEMRNNPTNAEKKLWNQIRPFRSEGFVFRRQHPIGIFVADFYCHKLKLVIEVDGEIYDSEEAREHDDGRTDLLERFGLKVFRFTNEQVINNQDYVLGQIKIFITEQSSPSLPGEGDKRG